MLGCVFRIHTRSLHVLIWIAPLPDPSFFCRQIRCLRLGRLKAFAQQPGVTHRRDNMRSTPSWPHWMSTCLQLSWKEEAVSWWEEAGCFSPWPPQAAWLGCGGTNPALPTSSYLCKCKICVLDIYVPAIYKQLINKQMYIIVWDFFFYFNVLWGSTVVLSECLSWA